MSGLHQAKRKTWHFMIGFLPVLLFSLALGIVAQDITSGTIQGTITDEQGAVVPGATVEARNVDTNFSRTFTTDDDGRFVLLTLPPGRYIVSVTKTGFTKSDGPFRWTSA